MFFIIWGEKSEYRPHGVVGDVCPVCERVRAFTVSDLYTAPHVYYITLGGWNFRARIRKCWTCGSDFYARLKDYDGFVEEVEAERLSLREIVQRTNRPLAERMASRAIPVRRGEGDREPNGRRDTIDDQDGRHPDRPPN